MNHANTQIFSSSSFSNSAPPKGVGPSLETHLELLDMKEHEQLFYNYLSILALIPEKHSEFMNILDTYQQRDKDTPKQSPESTNGKI